MTVSTIQSLSAGITQALGTKNTKLASSLSSLLSANTANPDAAQLSVAASLQTQVASLRVASQNIAQASSLIGVADSGVDEISQVLGRLQDLASQASSGDLSSKDRAQLDVQFQSLRQQINRIASTTSFNGQTLLDGSSQLDASGTGSDAASVGGFTDQDLFGGAALNVQTAASAQTASTAIATAQQYVAEQATHLDSLQSGLDVASSTVQSALQNQDAARSTLSDEDFTDGLFGSTAQPLQGDAALLAQTSRLPANLIQLLND